MSLCGIDYVQDSHVFLCPVGLCVHMYARTNIINVTIK